MTFSQYTETCEVLLDYPKIGGDDIIEDYARKATRHLLNANIDVQSRRLISGFSKDGIKCIEKLQSHCANMTFADKSRYDRTFQQVTHKGEESAINHIKRFQNTHALSALVGNIYSEDQLMHTFMDNFQQGVKYSTQIASHQAEMRREENFIDQKSLNISSLQTYYLNLDNILAFGKNSENENDVQTECNTCGGYNHSAERCFKKIRKEKEKSRTVDVSSNSILDEKNVVLNENSVEGKPCINRESKSNEITI